MKCFECEEDATHILKWDGLFQPICDSCLHEYIHFDGEINLDFWLLEFTGWEEILREINKELTYLHKRELKFHTDYLKLKKELG